MFATFQLPTTLETWLQDYPFLPGLLLATICLLILLLVALPRIASWRRGRGHPVLDPVQVEELILGAGALVVDLRGGTEFRNGHIRGCLHVPFEAFSTRFAAPDPAAKRALVLVDETDGLSHQAYSLLVGRGFTWIYVMKGGMKAWRRASRPLAK
jgi:rhodanese-related sulfurtransferase